MLFKVGDDIIDSEKVPVALIFVNDDQRVLVAQQIMNMVPKPGIRWYAQTPDDYTTHEFDKWAQLPEATDRNINNNPTGKPYCCIPGCNKDATKQIIYSGGIDDNSQSCDEHVEALGGYTGETIVQEITTLQA